MNRLIAAFVIVAAGCAELAPDRQSSTLSSPRNVAVVSLLGSQFHGVRVGTTVLGNLNYDVDVSDWNIDQFAEQVLASHLREKHSLVASPLNMDAAERRRFAQSEGLLRGDYDYGRVFALANAQGFDVLVLIKPTYYENARFHKPGYGFFERTFMGTERRCVYTLFTVDFRSVPSQTQMGWEWGRPCEGGEQELLWREKFNDFSDSERAVLRKRVEDSLRIAISVSASEAHRRAVLPPRGR
jgi:hypothetical protein